MRIVSCNPARGEGPRVPQTFSGYPTSTLEWARTAAIRRFIRRCRRFDAFVATGERRAHESSSCTPRLVDLWLIRARWTRRVARARPWLNWRRASGPRTPHGPYRAAASGGSDRILALGRCLGDRELMRAVGALAARTTGGGLEGSSTGSSSSAQQAVRSLTRPRVCDGRLVITTAATTRHGALYCGNRWSCCLCLGPVHTPSGFTNRLRNPARHLRPRSPELRRLDRLLGDADMPTAGRVSRRLREAQRTVGLPIGIALAE